MSASAPGALPPLGHLSAEGAEPASPSAAGVPVDGASPESRARAAGLTLFELARLEEARRRAAEVEARVRADARPASAVAPVEVGGVRARTWAVAGVLVLGGTGWAMSRPAADVTVAPAAVAVAPRPSAAASTAPGAASAAAPDAAAPFPVPDSTHPSFGRSRGVLVRTVLPGQVLEYPMVATTAPGALRYTWVRVADGSEAERPRPLAGSVVLVPTQAGLYHLALVRGEGRAPGERRVIDAVTVAVLVPFAEKLGPTLRGYRLGTWPFERFGGERPTGFVEVTPATERLRLSRHLTLRDFLTHDGQRAWPRYVAVNPALVDKLELVVGEIARLRGMPDAGAIRVNVHSGFRTPLHNRGVEGAALSSRHQYGDAADVAIDADGDGRFSSFDSRIVALAAEMVERRHPHLTGGLGLYLHANEPYVHVDTRGRRARWWR